MNATIMKNADALGDAIDKVILGSKRGRKLTARVRRAQRRLRRAVGERAWQVYLALEEIVNERMAREEDLLIRWAFREGRRCCR